MGSDLRGDARTALGLLRPQLRCQVLAEVVGFEHRAYFDFRLALAERRAPDPFDRFFERPHLPQPESGDQLLALGEGSVDHRVLAAAEPDAHAMGARAQPFRREQYTR